LNGRRRAAIIRAMLMEAASIVEKSQAALTAHILAVDDDPSVRKMIADYLGDNEMRVTTLVSGREIAETMQREAIDLVVLDLRLPGEDGMEIARRLRAESHVPIIMLTGRKDEADRVMGLELGADNYLTKPFSPRELLARIRALLRRARPADGGRRPAEGPRLPLRRLRAQRAPAPPDGPGRQGL
jgi:DNA-binding response OmpR family regulator